MITVTGRSLTHGGRPRLHDLIRAVPSRPESTLPTGEHVLEPAEVRPQRTGAWWLALVLVPGVVYAIEDGHELRLLVCDDHDDATTIAWSDLPIGVPPEQVETDPILGIGSITVVDPLLMRIKLTDGRIFDVPTPRGPQGDTGPATSLQIGTVTTGAVGSNATATITGTAPDQTLDLTLPRGTSGASTAAQITDATAAGRALLTAADAAAQRAALGVQQSLAGTGSPLGVVTPSRAGIIYVDTAATNGARQWISTGTNNTSWVVTDGDTGWRDLQTYLVNGATPIGAEPVMVRRVGAMVTMHLAISWPIPWDIGTAVMVAPLGGFMHPVGTGYMPPPYGDTMAVYGRTDGSTFSLEVYAYSDEARWTWTWMTDDPWPTTLPGSPA